MGNARWASFEVYRHRVYGKKNQSAADKVKPPISSIYGIDPHYCYVRSHDKQQFRALLEELQFAEQQAVEEFLEAVEMYADIEPDSSDEDVYPPLQVKCSQGHVFTSLMGDDVYELALSHMGDEKFVVGRGECPICSHAGHLKKKGRHQVDPRLLEKGSCFDEASELEARMPLTEEQQAARKFATLVDKVNWKLAGAGV